MTFKYGGEGCQRVRQGDAYGSGQSQYNREPLRKVSQVGG